eukprot:GDKI01030424.1.p1 GENE.GDKI01030424.1~~GDKI01030424.1.p1  ORF type:complete len:339 (-),score=78.15 GDKI01030424.1:181-1197(-)
MPLVKKASNFLGVLTLQQGCMVISAFQLLMAFVAYKLIAYFRPGLTPVGTAFAAVFALTSVVGLYAAYYRNLSVFRVFFGLFAVCFGLLVLLNLYLFDALPFIPMPPALEPFMTQGHPQQMGLAQTVNTNVNTHLKATFMQHKEAVALVGLSQYLHALPAVINGQSVPTGLLAVHHTDLPAHGVPAAKHTTKAANKVAVKPAEKPVIEKPVTKKPVTEKPITEKPVAEKPVAEKLAEEKPATETVHATTADEEEVSPDELPREFSHLSVEKEYEITAIMKIMKHSMRFVAAGALAVIVLFYIYFLWIVGTFWMNGCTAIDEGSLADQFEPTLDDAHDA